MNKEIEDNKPVNITLNIDISFYEEESKENQWGSNDISFEIYYNTKNGIMNVNEVGAFGDRTLINRFRDRRGRGITLKEMLENIEEISQMTYKEFREKVAFALLEEEARKNEKTRRDEKRWQAIFRNKNT